MKANKNFVLIFVILAVVFAIASCAPSASTKSEASAPTPMNSSSSVSESPAATTSAEVSIENFSFNPATLTVKEGTTVKWTNNDSMDHDVKSDSFSSRSLSKGQSFEFKFVSKGTYNYVCDFHRGMNGQIIVE